MNRSGIRSIAINAGYLAMARAVTSISRAVYALVLARLLGTELYGQFNYGLAWYLFFLPVSMLGVKWILSHEIGRNRNVAPKLVGTTFVLRSATALGSAFLSVMLALIFEQDDSMRLLLFLFSAALAGRSFSMWTNAVFTALESSGFVFVLEAIFRLLEVILGILLLQHGDGLLELALLHAASWLLQGAISYLFVLRLVGQFPIRASHQEVFHVVKRGLPFAIAALFSAWLLQGPVIMYRHWSGLSDSLGQLALALQAFTILAMIVGEMGNAALPVLTRAIERNDGKADRYVSEVFRLGWFMGGCLVIGALAVGDDLVLWLFGREYLEAAMLLPWSLFLVTFHFWIYSLQGIIGVHGHFAMVALGNFIAATVFSACFLLFVPLSGPVGSIWALGIGLSTVVILQLIVLRKYHNISLQNMLVKPALSVLAGIFICFILLKAGHWKALISGIIAMLLIAMAIGVFSIREFRVFIHAVRRY